MAEENTPEYDRSIEIGRDVSNSSVVSGDGNQITHVGTQLIQFSVAEVKTRPFNVASPYKGLKKFEQTDKDRFFGREQFIRQLGDALNQTNLLLLLGASGSGKSSVIRAGLVPNLEQQEGDRFINLTFNPDNDPFESLYASLLSHFGQTKTQFVRQGKAETLVQMVETLKSPDVYWLIFVDQFEELFTISQAEKCNQFIAGLIRLNQWLLNQVSVEDCRVKIVAAMRSDFLDRLSSYPDLVEATEHARPIIAELKLDELRLAIAQPAAHHGVVFEDGLVKEIINGVQGQAGYLPLLQYTLNLLWKTELEANGIQDRTLTTRVCFKTPS
jgi:energy-coupling factor transporter ATP-binding protein EcfA2